MIEERRWAVPTGLVLLSLLAFGCGGGSDQIAVRAVDLFQADAVSGQPVEVEEVEPLLFWKFDDNLRHPAPDKEAPLLGWKSTGISGLRLEDGVLKGRTTTDFPILYVDLEHPLQQKDVVHSIEVQMKTSAGANVAFSAGPGPANLERALDPSNIFGWSFRSPIVAGDQIQTYTMQSPFSLTAAGMGTVLLRPGDQVGAEFEIRSIELISTREHLSRIPSGVGWQGLSEIYRETIVARSPESIRLELQLPQQPFLDLNLGTVEESPVTFRIEVDGAQPQLLLKRTVTTPNRWEKAPVDLAAYSGKRVTLLLSLQADQPGRIGFWGSAAVRARGASPPVAVHPPASGAGPKQPPKGVILVMADTLRKDHLDAYGYGRETAPFLTRMAAGGVRFSDTISPASWTKVSSPSMMTSLYPRSHGVLDFPDRLPAAAETMAEIFREAGYATVSMSSVLFTGKFTNLHQGFEELHEFGSASSDHPSKTAREYVDRLTEWLSDHRDVPFFAFLHVFDPHDPYEPHPPYNTMWADPAGKAAHEAELEEARKVIADPLMRAFGMGTREEFQKAGVDAEQFVAYDKDWYDGSIRGLDAEMARLMERLEELGLHEQTLVVFTSDHGEEFLEHDRMFHGQTIYGELTNVPLVMHWPAGLPSEVVIDQTVGTIDLMPTILEASHLAVPEVVQGQSLLPLIASRQKQGSSTSEAAGWTPRPAFSTKAVTQNPGSPGPRHTESFAVVKEGWKLIHNTVRSDRSPEFELYDHVNDPLNLTDVAAQHPELVQQLAAEIAGWLEKVDAAKLPEASSTEGLSPAELERLRSLGYIQ